MNGLDQARHALRDRQGPGARYPAPEAPADALALTRSGTAYFARKLNDLSDAGLYEPSRVPGWMRAHVICDVAYRARTIAAQTEAVTAGLPPPDFHESEAARREAINLGATLPPRALRHLFDHSAVHLEVVWRDLPGAGWAALAPDDAGRMRPMSETATERGRLIWQAALDLNNGVRLHDVPAGLRRQIAQ